MSLTVASYWTPFWSSTWIRCWLVRTWALVTMSPSSDTMNPEPLDAGISLPLRGDLSQQDNSISRGQETQGIHHSLGTWNLSFIKYTSTTVFTFYYPVCVFPLSMYNRTLHVQCPGHLLGTRLRADSNSPFPGTTSPLLLQRWSEQPSASERPNLILLLRANVYLVPRY